ncbi:hypothetical protein DM02DRAFT_616321 [Periconia macrospinosa]|uniref:Uncharacterized protein n=1 Tax=Periconia macrospinosa TaxID=97972 RepID=A0A2V1DHP2_9PLEO|nr:hypothetical protein DM02DRAFT_616321 [Periconia macrospinosa]
MGDFRSFESDGLWTGAAAIGGWLLVAPLGIWRQTPEDPMAKGCDDVLYKARPLTRLTGG